MEQLPYYTLVQGEIAKCFAGYDTWYLANWCFFSNYVSIR